MFRTLSAAAAFAVIATTVLAQSDLVAARKAVMDGFGKHMYRALPDMLKGATPYNQATVDIAFVQLVDGAQKLPPLYTESTKDLPPSGRYGASQKVWANKADFDAKLANYSKAIADGRARATSLEGLKEAYAIVDRACDSCHESYRVRN